MIRGTRCWIGGLGTLGAVGLSACAIALAARGPVVTTGSLAIFGVGPGTVTVTGTVLVTGRFGPGRVRSSVVIRTYRTRARFNGRAIPAHSLRRFALTAGRDFFLLDVQGTVRVTMHGTGLSASVAGTATITFHGRGAYQPTFGRRAAWPKSPLRLLQPSSGRSALVDRAGAIGGVVAGRLL